MRSNEVWSKRFKLGARHMRLQRATELLGPLRHRPLSCQNETRRSFCSSLPSRKPSFLSLSSSLVAARPSPRQPTAEWRRSFAPFAKMQAHWRIARARNTPMKDNDLVGLKELYEALLADPVRDKSTTDEVVADYETRSKIFTDAPDPNNAFLTNQSLFGLYMRALVMTENGADKVLSATSRRSQILSQAPVPEVAPAPATEASVGAKLSSAQLMNAVFEGEGGGRAKVISTPITTGGYKGASSTTEHIRVTVTHEKEWIVWRILRPIFSALIWILVICTILSFVMESGPGGILKAAAGAGPTEFKAPPGSAPVTFADVHGCEEAKAELQEVVEFLKDPNKFTKLGGKLTRGVLLTGPPGTGKTLLARAIAGEAGVSFFIASGSDFDEMFVGVGAKRVRDLFAAARKGAPAIIFIDELDAVGGKRSPRDMQHMKQTLNQLLTEMDGFSQGSGIVVIGATNLPETLDKALIRPGRFDRQIAVPLPDVRGRLAILQHHVKRNKVPCDQSIDLGIIARSCPGFSGAELEALVNQAAVRASLDNSAKVTATQFEWARDRIMLGSERKSAVVTPESRRRTAWHEAGHAIVALFTPGADPLHKITVIPRGHALGITFQLPEMDRDSMSHAEYRAKIDVSMGGRAAEEMIYGHENVTSGAASDIEQATQIASAMVRRFGFSDAIGPVSMPEEESERHSSETRAVIEREIRTIIEGAQSRAAAMLRNKKAEFERLANALITYETLSGSEAKQVIQGEELKRPVL